MTMMMMQRLLTVLLVMLCIAVGGVEGQRRKQRGATRKAGSKEAQKKGSGSSLATEAERDLQVSFPIAECELEGPSGKGFGKKGKKSKTSDDVSPYCETGLPPETCLICAFGFCLCLDCFTFPEFCDCYQAYLDDPDGFFGPPGSGSGSGDEIDFTDFDVEELIGSIIYCWCFTVGLAFGDVCDVDRVRERRALEDITGSSQYPEAVRMLRDLMDADVIEEVTGGAAFGGNGGKIVQNSRGFPVIQRGFDPSQPWIKYTISSKQNTEVVWCPEWIPGQLCGEECTEGQFCCYEADPSQPGAGVRNQVCVDEADVTENVGDELEIPLFPRIGGQRATGPSFMN